MARIVVGVDGSAIADRALRWAVDEALLHHAEMELVLGYVLQVHRAALSTSNRDIAEETMRGIVERSADVLRRVPWKTTLAPLLGRPYADAVLDAADDADLIVVGSRGLGGFRELLLGSTSYRVASHAPIPVAVVRSDHAAVDGTCRGVVVGVDGSRAAVRALQWAIDEAALRAVDVTAVHGYFSASATLLSGVAIADQIEAEREHAHRQADEVMAGVLDAVDVPDGVHLARRTIAGTPAGAVLSCTAADQLTVVGTRGRGSIRRAALGSTSHQLLHHAPGPVVVVS